MMDSSLMTDMFTAPVTDVLRVGRLLMVRDFLTGSSRALMGSSLPFTGRLMGCRLPFTRELMGGSLLFTNSLMGSSLPFIGGLMSNSLILTARLMSRGLPLAGMSMRRSDPFDDVLMGGILAGSIRIALTS